MGDTSQMIIVVVGMVTDTISIRLNETPIPMKRVGSQDNDSVDMFDKFGVRFQSAEAFHQERLDDLIESMCS